MPTQEERLLTVENDLKQFKTETIKAYQEMAVEVTMVKGLTEDAIIRLATIKVQIDQRFGQVDARLDRVDARLDRVETRLDRVETRLDRMEMMLTEILARLPKP
jgi:archaellum component FlaC